MRQRGCGVKICERPFIPCSTVQLTQWIEMESEVIWRTSQPVFDLAGQQLQDVDLHKYKSSTLAGISGVERRGRTKRAGSGMWFWGVKKQLFEDCKSFHDVGPVCSIMMTLHPITPEWGTHNSHSLPFRSRIPVCNERPLVWKTWKQPCEAGSHLDSRSHNKHTDLNTLKSDN